MLIFQELNVVFLISHLLLTQRDSYEKQQVNFCNVKADNTGIGINGFRNFDKIQSSASLECCIMLLVDILVIMQLFSLCYSAFAVKCLHCDLVFVYGEHGAEIV